MRCRWPALSPPRDPSLVSPCFLLSTTIPVSLPPCLPPFLSSYQQRITEDTLVGEIDVAAGLTALVVWGSGEWGQALIEQLHR